MARRSNHEGSVYQRGDGLWVASIQLSGKRLYRYGKTKADASSKLRDVVRSHHQGTLAAPTRVTLSEWVDTWMGELELRPSTMRTYRRVLTPLTDDVGSVRLDKLTPVLLALTFSKLAKRGVGARSRQLAHGYLKSCLSRAVDLEMLGRNPASKVRRPEWTPRVRTYWTAAQAATFIETCQASRLRWAPLFIVLVTCGLRVSEALGLRRGDVDLAGHLLHVRRALVWYGEDYNDGDVKTQASIRDLCLTSAAVPAFEQFGMPADAAAPIFRTSAGEPPSPSQLHRPLKALCKAAGVPFVNVHGLRHVHAALVYRSTKDAYAVQARLGHTDVSFTMRQYGYGVSTDQETATALDGLLGGKTDASAP